MCFLFSTLLVIIYNKYLKQKLNKIGFLNKEIKICILIISAPSERWNLEKEVWKKYMKSHSNIDCFFIECNNYDNVENNTITSKCEESFRPGIFYKTIKSLEKVRNKYDYYVRSNLSTFFILDNLYEELQYLPTNKLVYTGKRYFNMKFNEDGVTIKDNDTPGKQIKFIGGTSIILNNIACNFLLKNYLKYSMYFNKFSDDSLIGYIFQTENIDIYNSKNIHELYIWDNEKSTKDNIKSIETNKNAYIRTRGMKNKQENFNALLKTYYHKNV
jgi:hypothetical protein